MKAYAFLSEKEVIELRIAYMNHESPSDIYNQKYKDRICKAAFMNIWSGKRYTKIMPEVFVEKYRHTKLDEETVKKIRYEHEVLKMSYNQLAKKYNVSKSTIYSICTYKTWKTI